jgi:hypothetical protein
MRNSVIALFLLLAFPIAYAQTAADLRFPALITYPGPQGLSPSPWYTVTVSQGHTERRSFVYMVNNIGLAQNNWQQHAWNNSTELTTSFTSFDFNDPGATFSTPGIAPVTVRVTMPIPTPAWRSPAVRILPSASKIVPSSVVQVNGTYQVSFEVHFATQYSVEFYDAAAAPDFSTWVPDNPLLIFANPLERDVPRPDAPNVRVLKPGDLIPVSGSGGLSMELPSIRSSLRRVSMISDRCPAA